MKSLAVLFLLLVACNPSRARRDEAEGARMHEEPPRATRSVVLITIDGVRWEDVFLGLDRRLARPRQRGELRPFAFMPETKALIDASGLALGGGGPGCGTVVPRNDALLSLPGYLEILGGRATGCDDNDCARTEQPTVLDAAASATPYPVASIASWGKLARAASSGRGSVFVSAGRSSWPAFPESAAIAKMLRASAVAAPYPGHGDYRPDRHTEQLALAYYESRRPRLLHVALGDTDELAHRRDYRGYLRALRDADRFVARLAALAMAKDPDTVFLVTTDHGRDIGLADHGAAFPLSRRSFVLAFGAGVPRRGAVCEHRNIDLPDVGATIRALLELPRDAAAGAGVPIFEISGDG